MTQIIDPTLKQQLSAQAPQSEQELRARVELIAGLTLAEVASALNQSVPLDQSTLKGWVGELLEQALGATAGSKPVPDFEQIGVELKTIPVSRNGTPTESTYVCTAPTDASGLGTWAQSHVRIKLDRVLWLPVEAERSIPLPHRRVGNGLVWSPTSEQEAILQGDWEELVEQIAIGQVDQISAHQGQYLQLRPKAANARSRRPGVSPEGRIVPTLPRGFYLRSRFTGTLLGEHFHLR